MLVKVTVYEDVLCIETQKEAMDHDNFVPCGDGKVGCVLMNTKEFLGLSEEAVEWLRKVPTSRDDIGDVDVWRTSDGMGCFGWLGGLFSIKHLEGISGSHSYDLDSIEYNIVPNDTPREAIVVIDKSREEANV